MKSWSCGAAGIITGSVTWQNHENPEPDNNFCCFGYSERPLLQLLSRSTKASAPNKVVFMNIEDLFSDSWLNLWCEINSGRYVRGFWPHVKDVKFWPVYNRIQTFFFPPWISRKKYIFCIQSFDVAENVSSQENIWMWILQFKRLEGVVDVKRILPVRQYNNSRNSLKPSLH